MNRRDQKAAAIYAQSRPESISDILKRLPIYPVRPPHGEHALLGDQVWDGEKWVWRKR